MELLKNVAKKMNDGIEKSIKELKRLMNTFREANKSVIDIDAEIILDVVLENKYTKGLSFPECFGQHDRSSIELENIEDWDHFYGYHSIEKDQCGDDDVYWDHLDEYYSDSCLDYDSWYDWDAEEECFEKTRKPQIKQRGRGQRNNKIMVKNAVFEPRHKYCRI